MKKGVMCLSLLLVAVWIVTGGPAIASTITFNDLSTPNTGSNIANWGVIPTTYAGFTWTGWEVIDGQSFNTVYGSIFSGPFPNNAAYNGGSGNLQVDTSGSPFNFIGADFSFWPKVDGYASPTVTITGYLNNVQVGSPKVVTLGTGFSFTSVNLNRVDKVTFTSASTGKYWLMDNFQTTPVPEPMTSALIGLGLIGLSLIVRIRHSD